MNKRTAILILSLSSLFLSSVAFAGIEADIRQHVIETTRRTYSDLTPDHAKVEVYYDKYEPYKVIGYGVSVITNKKNVVIGFSCDAMGNCSDPYRHETSY